MTRDQQPTQDETLLRSRFETARLFVGPDVPLSEALSYTRQLETEHPSLVTYIQDAPFFGSDAVEHIETCTPPPAEWCSASALAIALTCDESMLRSVTRALISEEEELIGEFKKRTPRGEEASFFLSPKLVSLVSGLVEEKMEQASKIAEARSLKASFDNFVDRMKDESSIESVEFKMLVELFGPESGLDILMQYRPEYTRVPVDMVKSFLSDYLGTLVVKKGYLNLENLPKTVEFLNNETLRNCLVEVIKNHCIAYYLATRRKGIEQDDLGIISSHLDFLREQIEEINDENLLQVLNNVEDYYTWLFVEIDKPDTFVASIDGERPFPDLGQRINVGEVITKRRMLIADEPGTGKSASAIMAKETVGARCALIVTPPSMISTWAGYLSDQVSEDGKQIGYFKKGQAPRVLVVDSLHVLDAYKEDDYDYVLLSHHRLTQEYTDKLKSMGFDMLITDEAHELKNLQEGLRASQLVELADHIESINGYSVLLTATPAPNKVSDIAMTLRLLYPNDFKDLSNAELALRIINGDYIDLRTLLVPRMQRKEITQTIDMPPLVEREIPLRLSKAMSDVYELLLEDDEMTSSEKIQRIRQFLSNPASLEATPDIPSEKAIVLGENLAKHFVDEDKILMFVNDYMTNIIRGKRTIQDSLGLPEGITITTITGDSSQQERLNARMSFQNDEGKQLLIVSGSIAGVGVDFSAADRVIFFNEPWNKSIKRQQIGRAYRPGRKNNNPLHVDTYYFDKSLEEGMIRYSVAKERAINKLLSGIDLNELEKTALRFEEEQKRDEAELNLNHELAAYYYSSWQRMLRMFGHVKEIGTEDFQKSFLPPHGKEYANTYRELMYRSYQANAARLSGSLLSEMVQERSQDPTRVRVLDIASGPEMLTRHVPENLAQSVVSLDMNGRHFSDKIGPALVGSMNKLPIAEGSIDYINLSLALHYTKQHMREGIYERIETLSEVNRVLKVGGRAFITMIYSYQFEDMDRLTDGLHKLGFRIVKRSSGDVESGTVFSAQLLTLEKTGDAPHVDSLTVKELQELSGALKLMKRDVRLKDTRRVAQNYSIKKRRTLVSNMNARDRAVLGEETQILESMAVLRKKYGGVAEIPADELTKAGYSRIVVGKRPVLFSRLKTAIGSVIYR